MQFRRSIALTLALAVVCGALRPLGDATLELVAPLFSAVQTLDLSDEWLASQYEGMFEQAVGEEAADLVGVYAEVSDSIDEEAAISCEASDLPRANSRLSLADLIQEVDNIADSPAQNFGGLPPGPLKWKVANSPWGKGDAGGDGLDFMLTDGTNNIDVDPLKDQSEFDNQPPVGPPIDDIVKVPNLPPRPPTNSAPPDFQDPPPENGDEQADSGDYVTPPPQNVVVLHNPEPSALAVWTLLAAGTALYAKRRRHR